MEDQFSFDLSTLHDNPFGQRADGSHPYLSLSFREALAALYYGLEYGSRILMVTAGPGLGKTTLLRYFERRMQDRGRTFFVAVKDAPASEVMRKLIEIGETVAHDDLLARRTQVDEIFAKVAEAEDPFILLLDYEENAAGPALDILRELTSLESFRKGLLRILIAVSGDTGEELQRSELSGEIRRVPLSPLTAAEVEAYIDYRARQAGWRGERLLGARECTSIAEQSSGSPSAINEICFKLLQDQSEGREKTPDGPDGNQEAILLQDLSERQAEQSNGADGNQEAILEESQVDFSIAGRSSNTNAIPGDATDELAPPPPSLDRRMTALVCIAFVLIIAIAGFWYRSAIMAHLAKHVAAKTTTPLAFSAQHAIFQGQRQKGLPDPPPLLIKDRAANEGIITSAVATVTSTPARDELTEMISPVALPALSPMASPERGNATTLDAVAVRLTNSQTPFVSSSPPATALDNVKKHAAETIGKKDQNLKSAPFSRFTVASSTSTWFAVPAKIRATPTAPAPRIPMAIAKDSGTRVNKLAAYEIRLGDSYMSLGDYDKAFGSFSRAIALAPNYPKAEQRIQEMTAYEIRLGDAYMNMGDYDKALRSFSRVIDFAPDNKEAQEKIRRARRAKAAEETVLQ